jgi:hypothetical protein
MRRLPRRFRSKIEFVVGESMKPELATAEILKDKVMILRGENP